MGFTACKCLNFLFHSTAIEFYKRAVRLVPDIESRITDYNTGGSTFVSCGLKLVSLASLGS